MEFEWDVEKAESNWRKHGVRFEEAVKVFADPFQVESPDQAVHYGEDRFAVIALVGNVEVIVVFTERGRRTRLISARRANKNEQESYWKYRLLHLRSL